MRNYIEERKRVEKAIITNLIKDNHKIYHLVRNDRTKEIQSFSPFSVEENTNLPIHRNQRYNYNHLSKKIHKVKDGRFQIEKEIDKLLPMDKDILPHILFKEFDEFYIYENRELKTNGRTQKNLIAYCNRMKCNLPNKKALNKIRKLILKWRIISENYHYKISKQDKRKLKKLSLS